MNILSARHGLFTSLFHRREPRPPSGWQSTRDMQDSGELVPVEHPAQQQTTGEIRLDFARIREWNPTRRKGRVREAYEQYLMRPVQEPVYTLPAPAPRGTTGAIRPVRLVPDTGALTPMERPEWVDDLLRHGVQESPEWLTAEPAQPENWLQGKQSTDAMEQLAALASGENDDTIEVPAIMRRRHTKESEQSA